MPGTLAVIPFLLVYDSDELFAALRLMAVGMSVVFAALVLLLVAITLIDRLGRDASAPRDATGTTPTPAPTSGELTPRLVAVLAAAATTTLQQPVRVVHARRATDEGQDDHESKLESSAGSTS